MELSSEVAAPADEVWRHVTRFEGINDELRPLLRMTVPRGWQGRTLAEVKPPERLGRSWLLWFGVIPIDYDDIGIAEVGPGPRFLERSRMLSASTWQHERVVEQVSPDSCRVTDRVGFIPRCALMGWVLRRVVPLLFAHRHRRLRHTVAARLRSGPL